MFPLSCMAVQPGRYVTNATQQIRITAQQIVSNIAQKLDAVQLCTQILFICKRTNNP